MIDGVLLGLECSSSSRTTEGCFLPLILSPMPFGSPLSRLLDVLTPTGVLGKGLLLLVNPKRSKDLTDEMVSDRSRKACTCSG
jgi:hypothetical protein